MQMPFSLDGWIDDNAHRLRPPVSNAQLWGDSPMIVTIVGGGNERTDYHDDPRPEFFHQLVGDMILRIQPAAGEPPHDIPIRQGEVFMLPPHVRHSPQRPDPNSRGMVVEYARDEGERDAFEWYCPACFALIHRAEIQLQSIVDDLPPVFTAFYDDVDARTCPACGHLHPGRNGA